MRDDEIRVLMFLTAFDFERAEWERSTEGNYGELTCYYPGKDEPFGMSEFVIGSLTREAWLNTEEWLYFQDMPDTKYRLEE